MTVQVLTGNSLDVLRGLPASSAQCCITSPPYWGAQRDYGVPGQLGMERTPEEYIAALGAVFGELRRVLAPDGVAWVNLGDAYAASGKGGGGSMMLKRGHRWRHRAHLKGWRSPPPGYKQKDLVGTPWMLAFALRSSGWYLRRDIVWDKGSATEPTRADRPSGSHEMLFLLSQDRRYRFDASPLPHGTVWRVRPSGTYEGHAATFPPELIEPCILSSSSPGDTIIDPFGGAGTTALVADRLQRNAVMIELNPEYSELARARVTRDAPLFADVQ